MGEQMVSRKGPLSFDGEAVALPGKRTEMRPIAALSLTPMTATAAAVPGAA